MTYENPTKDDVIPTTIAQIQAVRASLRGVHPGWGKSLHNIPTYIKLTTEQLESKIHNIDTIKQWWAKLTPKTQKQPSNTPIISVKMGGEKFKGLFDTGAGASIMSKDTCFLSHSILNNSTRTCRVADQSDLSVLGETVADVELGGE